MDYTRCWSKEEVHKAPRPATSGLAGSRSPFQDVIHLQAGAGRASFGFSCLNMLSGDFTADPRKALLLKAGRRKVRQEIGPRDLLTRGARCIVRFPKSMLEAKLQHVT